MLAALVRLQSLLFFFIPCYCTIPALASALHGFPSPGLIRRDFVLNNATGTPQFFNPATGQPILQGPGTDGGGLNFSAAAILWISFCFLVGPPMSAAGIRGWRLTTGVGIGLLMAVCSWVAFISSVSNIGMEDTVLTVFVLGFFAIGFVLGLFEFTYVAGIATIGIAGGLAFGIRIVIIKDGLLLSGSSLYAVNWLLTAVCGVLGLVAIILSSTQRAGLVFGSASVGTFLVSLGLDLSINKQSGMSRGLRFFFDRNVSHTLDIIIGGYHPPVSTQILLAVSLVLTPVLAFTQHRIFKHPFSRSPEPDSPIGYSPSVISTDGDKLPESLPPRRF